MRKILAVLAVAFVAALPLQSAVAQDNTLGGALIGGGIGAIVGGVGSSVTQRGRLCSSWPR